MNMQNAEYRELKETGWRRPLNPQEQALLQSYLAENPAGLNPWKEEAALNHLLQRWPAPRVSANFTARLMKALPPGRPTTTWRDWFVLSQWLPEGAISRLAMCSLMVGLGLFSFREYQSMHRVRVARDLAGVSRLAGTAPMEWWKDFDTINKMNKVKVADDDLLAALQ